MVARRLALLGLLTALTVLLLGGLPAASSAAVPGEWERATAGKASAFETTYALETDGSVRVTQDITWQFQPGETRRGIIRSVQVRAGYRDSETQYRYYELSEVSVTSPTGAPTDITIDDFGAEKQIRIGSPSRTVTGTQEYIVRFRLSKVVNDIGDGTAEFYFNNVSTNNEYEYDDLKATVTGPAASTRVDCFYGPRGSDQRCTAGAGSASTFTLDRLDAGEGMSILASYPRSAFGDLAPDLRSGNADSGRTSTVSPEVSRVAAALIGGVGIFVPLLAAAGMGALVWQRGRDEQYAGLTPGLSPGLGQDVPVVRSSRELPFAVQFSPPAGVQPGMLGTVIDEEANVVDVSATVIDLAVRGFLTLQPVEGSGFRREDWLLTRTQPPPGAAPLAAYEQALLDGLFATGPQVMLSQLKNHFASTLAQVQRLMYDEVVLRGWFRRSPQAARGAYSWIGMLLLVAAGVAVFFLGGALSELTADSGWPFPPHWLLGGGLVVAAFVVRSLGNRMAARTAEGSAVTSQSRGFEQYLTTAEAGQIKWEEAQSIFSRYLPYAIVFGVAERWASVFEEVSRAAAAAGVMIPAPTWYIGPWATTSFTDVAGSMDSFSTTAAGTFVSTPGSSGGSGFSSGGGFSGGGGSGGGGGEW